jgi:hypothetical protein
LAKNGTIELSADLKKEYLKSFYIAKAAVKPTSTDENTELVPKFFRMSGFMPA